MKSFRSCLKPCGRLSRLLAAVLSGGLGLLILGTSITRAGPPNVLFIAVDDLRPELGCYGVPHVQSPNIDRLAQRGVVFTRAYCQEALCGPSRASLLTGCRPDTTGVTHNEAYFRDQLPDIPTLPQYFKNHGYVTIGIGKVFHPGKDDPASWTEKPDLISLRQPPYPRPVGGYQLPENRRKWEEQAAQARREGIPSGEVWRRIARPATECADVPDQAYLDGLIADTAIAAIRRHKAEPFFLAVGFLKPHLPFVAPKKYWDLYDAAKLPLAANPFPPRDCPPIALPPGFELRFHSDIPKDGPLPEEIVRRLIHGYLACTSYIDAQIGRLLDELENNGLTQNTIVVFWGDHGWQLGEHGLWGKASNFELAARVPLIVAAPYQKSRGSRCSALVELVDVYPTLCELAGLPLPAHLEGDSFAPLLDNPNREWKKAAFTQFPCPALREWAGLPLDSYMSHLFQSLLTKVEKQIRETLPSDYSLEDCRQHLMGYTMRTDRYRLVVWCDDRNRSRPLAVELYDHARDPQENANVAGSPEYAAVVSELMEHWRKGWIFARPPKNAL